MNAPHDLDPATLAAGRCKGMWSCILGYVAGLVAVLLLIAIAAQDLQTDAHIGPLEWVTIGYGPIGIVLGVISIRWSNVAKRMGVHGLSKQGFQAGFWAIGLNVVIPFFLLT